MQIFPKYILLALCLTLFAGGAQGQTTWPVKVNKKWGLIDSTGNLVIPPNFDAIGEMEDGFAIVMSNQTYGVIREDGKIVVPLKYNMILRNATNNRILMLNQGGEIFNGMTRGGKWGFFNETAETVMEPAYDSFGPFTDQLVKVSNNGKEGLVLREGKEVVPCQYEFVSIASGGKAYLSFRTETGLGLTDLMGKTILEPKYEEVFPLEDGRYALVEKGNWGIASINGKELFSPAYDSLIVGYEGSYLFRNTEKLWGYCDSTGTTVIPAKFIGLSGRGNGWLQTETENGKGIYTAEGTEVLPPKFESVRGLSRDYIMAVQAGKTGVYDRKGTLILPHSYSQVEMTEGNRFLCGTDSGLVILDSQAERLIPETLDSIGEFEFQVAVVQVKGKMGLLHANGTLLKEPIYDRIERFETVCQLYTGAEKESLYLTREGEVTRRRQFKIVKGREVIASGGATATWGGNINRSGEWGALPASVGWYFSNTENAYGLRPNLDPNRPGRSLPPKYDRVTVVGQTDLTKVAIKKPGSTPQNTQYVYGLVNHKYAKELIEPAFVSLRHQDFNEHNVALAVTGGGRQILLKKNGHMLSSSEVTYIGAFSHGYLRVCKGGKKVWKVKEGNTSLESRPAKGMDVDENRQEYLEIQKGKWGLVDKNGNWVLPARYDYISQFEGGMTTFIENGKWGVMDITFTHLVEPVYDFTEVITVEDSSFIRADISSPAYGFIDQEGEMVLPARFQKTGPFAEGLAAAKQNGKWGYIDREGNWVIEPQFRDAGSFSEGFAKVLTFEKGRAWSVIDRSGTPAFSQKFFRIREFHEGRAAAQQGGSWGFIDTQGEWIAKPEFRKVLDFDQGVAIVTKRGRQGVIDLNGKAVVQPQYYSISDFVDGIAVVRKKTGYGLINKKGEKITRAKYAKMGQFKQGLAYFRDGNQYGFLNREGKEAIKAEYALARDFTEGLAAVRMGGKWGFIDTTGKMVLEPQWAHARSFSEGFSAVREGDGWGFINKEGNQVIRAVYTQVGDFHEGRATACTREKKWGYVDGTCRFVIPAQYDNVSDFEQGIARVKKDEDWGYINTLGGPVTLVKFREIQPYHEGLAAVRIELQAGLFDKTGKPLLDTGYDSIKEINGLLQVERSGQIGYVNARAEWIWDLKD